MYKIKKSITSLHKYCKNEGYKGYSLYDSHTGKIPFEKFGKSISFFSNQLVKRSPVNIRPVIGVPKTYNPKGMGLFLHSYSLLRSTEYDGLSDEELKELTDFFFNYLLNHHSEGYSGICWGYHYDWPRSDGSMFKAFTPSVVVTAFICRAMMECLKVEPSATDKVKETINSAVEFVLNDVYCTEHERGICFSYTPSQRDTVFNANLLAAEILAYDDYLQQTDRHVEKVKKVLTFTVNHQNEDGSWYYSLHPKTGKSKNQIDFHQGYMVETIYRICETGNYWTEELEKSVKNGIRFYKERQFDDKGVSLWRYPQKWPVDVHNQSQGIITFALMDEYGNDFRDFAEVIAKWSINNMQAKDGRFYYQKWPLLTSKVPYIRWNQGWMMVALATLLAKNKK